jgi:hypothetical protein
MPILSQSGSVMQRTGQEAHDSAQGRVPLQWLGTEPGIMAEDAVRPNGVVF